MTDGASREPRKGDFSQVARSVVQEATRDLDPDRDFSAERDAHLAALGSDLEEARRLQADPATQEWIEATRASLKAGEFDAELRDQPPVDEVIAKLKARR